MTQSAVASASGLRQKTVSLLETEPKRCSVDSLVRYLAAIRVAINLEATANEPPTTTKDTW